MWRPTSLSLTQKQVRWLLFILSSIVHSVRPQSIELGGDIVDGKVDWKNLLDGFEITFSPIGFRWAADPTTNSANSLCDTVITTASANGQPGWSLGSTADTIAFGDSFLSLLTCEDHLVFSNFHEDLQLTVPVDAIRHPGHDDFFLIEEDLSVAIVFDLTSPEISFPTGFGTVEVEFMVYAAGATARSPCSLTALDDINYGNLVAGGTRVEVALPDSLAAVFSRGAVSDHISEVLTSFEGDDSDLGWASVIQGADGSQLVTIDESFTAIFGTDSSLTLEGEEEWFLENDIVILEPSGDCEEDGLILFDRVVQMTFDGSDTVITLDNISATGAACASTVVRRLSGVAKTTQAATGSPSQINTSQSGNAGDLILVFPDVDDEDCVDRPIVSYITATGVDDTIFHSVGSPCLLMYHTLEAVSVTLEESDFYADSTLHLTSSASEISEGDILAVFCSNLDGAGDEDGIVAEVFQVDAEQGEVTLENPFSLRDNEEKGGHAECNFDTGDLFVSILSSSVAGKSVTVSLPAAASFFVSEDTTISLSIPNVSPLWLDIRSSMFDSLQCSGQLTLPSPKCVSDSPRVITMAEAQAGVVIQFQVDGSVLLPSASTFNFFENGDESAWTEFISLDAEFRLLGYRSSVGGDGTEITPSGIPYPHGVAIGDIVVLAETDNLCAPVVSLVVDISDDGVYTIANEVTGDDLDSCVMYTWKLLTPGIPSTLWDSVDSPQILSGDPNVAVDVVDDKTMFIVTSEPLLDSDSLVFISGSDGDCSGESGLYDVVDFGTTELGAFYVTVGRPIDGTSDGDGVDCSGGMLLEVPAVELELTSAKYVDSVLEGTGVGAQVSLSDFVFLSCGDIDGSGNAGYVIGYVDAVQSGEVSLLSHDQEQGHINCESNDDLKAWQIVPAESPMFQITTAANDDFFVNSEMRVDFSIDEDYVGTPNDLSTDCYVTFVPATGYNSAFPRQVFTDDDGDGLADFGFWNNQASLAVTESMIQTGKIPGADTLSVVIHMDVDAWDIDSDEEKDLIAEGFEASGESESWALVLASLMESDYSGDGTLPNVSDEDILVTFPATEDYEISSPSTIQFSVTPSEGMTQGMTLPDVKIQLEEVLLIFPDGYLDAPSVPDLDYYDSESNLILGKVEGTSGYWITWAHGPSSEPLASAHVVCEVDGLFAWQEEGLLSVPASPPTFPYIAWDGSVAGYPEPSDGDICLLSIFDELGRGMSRYAEVVELDASVPKVIIEAGLSTDFERGGGGGDILSGSTVIGSLSSGAWIGDEEVTVTYLSEDGENDDGSITRARVGSKFNIKGDWSGTGLGSQEGTVRTEWVEVSAVEGDGYASLTLRSMLGENHMDATEVASMLGNVTTLSHSFASSFVRQSDVHSPTVNVDGGDPADVCRVDNFDVDDDMEVGEAYSHLGAGSSIGGLVYGGLYGIRCFGSELHEAEADGEAVQSTFEGTLSLGPPAQAHPPLLENSNHDSITLHWPQLAFDGGRQLESYQVECTTSYGTVDYDEATSWELASDVIDESDEEGNLLRRATLDGMDQSTRYWCRVVATNSIGSTSGYIGGTEPKRRCCEILEGDEGSQTITIDRDLNEVLIAGHELLHVYIDDDLYFVEPVSSGTEIFLTTPLPSSAEGKEIFVSEHIWTRSKDDPYQRPHPPTGLRVSHSLKSGLSLLTFQWVSAKGSLSRNYYTFTIWYMDEDDSVRSWAFRTQTAYIQLGEVGSGADTAEISGDGDQVTGDGSGFWDRVGGSTFRVEVRETNKLGNTGVYAELGFHPPTNGWSDIATHCQPSTSYLSFANLHQASFESPGWSAAEVFDEDEASQDEISSPGDWSATLETMSRNSNGVYGVLESPCLYGPGVTTTKLARQSVNGVSITYLDESSLSESGGWGTTEEAVASRWSEAYESFHFTVSGIEDFSETSAVDEAVMYNGYIHFALLGLSSEASASDLSSTLVSVYNEEEDTEAGSSSVEPLNFSPTAIDVVNGEDTTMVAPLQLLPPKVMASSTIPGEFQVLWERPYSPATPVREIQLQYHEGSHLPEVLSLGSDARHHVVNGLGGTTYWVSVRACTRDMYALASELDSDGEVRPRSSGCGQWSVEVPVTTAPPSTFSDPQIGVVEVAGTAAVFFLTSPSGSSTSYIVSGEIVCKTSEDVDWHTRTAGDVRQRIGSYNLEVVDSDGIISPERSISFSSETTEISVWGFESVTTYYCVSTYRDYFGRSFTSSPVALTTLDDPQTPIKGIPATVQPDTVDASTSTLKIALPAGGMDGDVGECRIVLLQALDEDSRVCPNTATFEETLETVAGFSFVLNLDVDGEAIGQVFEISVDGSDLDLVVDGEDTDARLGVGFCASYACGFSVTERRRASDRLGVRGLQDENPALATFSEPTYFKAGSKSPGKVEDLSAEDVLDRAALLSWSPAQSNGAHILSYTVECSRQETPDEVSVTRTFSVFGTRQDGSTILEGHIWGLEPETFYDCVMFGTNSVGDGEYSSSRGIHTVESTSGIDGVRQLPIAPLTPQLSTLIGGINNRWPVTSSQITVQWQAPCAAIATDDDVLSGDIDVGEMRPDCLGSGDNTFLANSEEGSEASQGVGYTGSDDAVRIVGYVLRYRASKGGTFEYIWFDESSRNSLGGSEGEDGNNNLVGAKLRLTEFVEGGEEYELSVAAVNNYAPLLVDASLADLHFSSPLVVATLDGSPPDTPRMSVARVLASSIQFDLEWEDVSHNGGRITFLHSQCSEALLADPWSPQNGAVVSSTIPMTPLLPSFSVTNLSPATEYVCRARLENSFGLSEWSHNYFSASGAYAFTSDVATVPSAPPLPLEAVTSSSSSITVTWERPGDSGSDALVGYSLTLSEVTSDDAADDITLVGDFEVSPNDNAFTFTGLKHTSAYRASIQALNSHWLSCAADDREKGVETVFVGTSVDSPSSYPRDPTLIFTERPRRKVLTTPLVTMPTLSTFDIGAESLILKWSGPVEYHTTNTGSSTVLQQGAPSAAAGEEGSGMDWTDVAVIEEGGVTPDGWLLWPMRYVTALQPDTAYAFRLACSVTPFRVDGPSVQTTWYSNWVQVVTTETPKPLSPLPVSMDGWTVVVGQTEDPPSLTSKYVRFDIGEGTPSQELGSGGGGYLVSTTGAVGLPHTSELVTTNIASHFDDGSGISQLTSLQGNIAYEFDISYEDGEGQTSRKISNFVVQTSSCSSPDPIHSASVLRGSGGEETSIGSNGVMLSWDPPSDGGQPFTYYEITCWTNELMTDGERSSQTPDAAWAAWYIDDLKEDTHYFCIVVAVAPDDACSSQMPSSPLVDFTTASRQPLFPLTMPPPILVTCTTEFNSVDVAIEPRATTITLAWLDLMEESLDLAGENSEGFEFNLEMQWVGRDGVDVSQPLDLTSPTTNAAQVTGLLTTNSYMFRVRATNRDSLGAWSPYLDLSMLSELEASVPLSPADGQVYSQVRNMLHVTWSLPDNGGSIVDSVLCLCQRGAPIGDDSDPWSYAAEASLRADEFEFREPLDVYVNLVTGNGSERALNVGDMGTDEDEGDYTYWCKLRAHNAIGVSSWSLPFKASSPLPDTQGHPITMPKPGIVERTSTSITVALDPPGDWDLSPVLGYTCWLLRGDQVVAEVSLLPLELPTHQTFDELSANTEYAIYAVSYNRYQFDPYSPFTSEPSPTLTASTRRASRPGVALAPLFVASVEDAVMFLYAVPDDGGSPITTTEIHCAEWEGEGEVTNVDIYNHGESTVLCDSGESCQSQGSSSHTSGVVSDLASSTAYHCVMVVENEEGRTFGVPTLTPFETLAEGQGGSLGLSRPPECEVESESEVFVQWTAPEGDAVTEYSVEVSLLGRSSSFLVSSSTSFASISGLLANTDYRFSVSHSASSAVSSCDATTAAGAPSEISPRPTVVDVTDQMALVSWLAPDDNGEAIESYSLDCNDDVSLEEDEWFPSFSQAVVDFRPDHEGKMYGILGGLEPTTAYDCRLRAVNAVGVGDYSSTFPVETVSSPTVPLTPLPVVEDDMSEEDQPYDAEDGDFASFEGPFKRGHESVKIKFGTEIPDLYSNGLGGSSVDGFVIRWKSDGDEIANNDGDTDTPSDEYGEVVIPIYLDGVLTDEDKYYIFTGLDGATKYSFTFLTYVDQSEDGTRRLSNPSPTVDIVTEAPSLSDTPDPPQLLDATEDVLFLQIPLGSFSNGFSSEKFLQSYAVACIALEDEWESANITAFAESTNALFAVGNSRFFHIVVPAHLHSVDQWVCRSIVIRSERQVAGVPEGTSDETVGYYWSFQSQPMQLSRDNDHILPVTPLPLVNEAVKLPPSAVVLTFSSPPHAGGLLTPSVHSITLAYASVAHIFASASLRPYELTEDNFDDETLFTHETKSLVDWCGGDETCIADVWYSSQLESILFRHSLTHLAEIEYVVGLRAVAGDVEPVASAWSSITLFSREIPTSFGVFSEKTLGLRDRPSAVTSFELIDYGSYAPFWHVNALEPSPPETASGKGFLFRWSSPNSNGAAIEGYELSCHEAGGDLYRDVASVEISVEDSFETVGEVRWYEYLYLLDDLVYFEDEIETKDRELSWPYLCQLKARNQLGVSEAVSIRPLPDPNRKDEWSSGPTSEEVYMNSYRLPQSPPPHVVLEETSTRTSLVIELGYDLLKDEPAGSAWVTYDKPYRMFAVVNPSHLPDGRAEVLVEFKPQSERFVFSSGFESLPYAEVLMASDTSFEGVSFDVVREEEEVYHLGGGVAYDISVLNVSSEDEDEVIWHSSRTQLWLESPSSVFIESAGPTWEVHLQVDLDPSDVDCDGLAELVCTGGVLETKAESIPVTLPLRSCGSFCAASDAWGETTVTIYQYPLWGQYQQSRQTDGSDLGGNDANATVDAIEWSTLNPYFLNTSALASLLTSRPPVTMLEEQYHGLSVKHLSNDGAYIVLDRVDPAGNDFTFYTLTCSESTSTLGESEIRSTVAAEVVGQVVAVGITLEPGITYVCRNEFETTAGYVDPSNTHSDVTPPFQILDSGERAAPFPPSKPFVVFVSSDSVSVSWTAPVSAGGTQVKNGVRSTVEIVSYMIEARCLTQPLPVVQVEVSISGELLTSVSGLIPGQDYAISVAAKNDWGLTGPPGPPTLVSLEPEVPGIVGPPKAKSESATSIRLTLNGKDETVGARMDGGHTIDRYLVEFAVAPDGYEDLLDWEKDQVLTDLDWENPNPNKYRTWPLRVEVGGGGTRSHVEREIVLEGLERAQAYLIQYACVSQVGVGHGLRHARPPAAKSAPSWAVAFARSDYFPPTDVTVEIGGVVNSVDNEDLEIRISVGDDGNAGVDGFTICTTTVGPLHLLEYLDKMGLAAQVCDDVTAESGTVDQSSWVYVLSTTLLGNLEGEPRVYRGQEVSLSVAAYNGVGYSNFTEHVPYALDVGAPYPPKFSQFSTTELWDGCIVGSNVTCSDSFTVQINSGLSWHGGSNYSIVSFTVTDEDGQVWKASDSSFDGGSFQAKVELEGLPESHFTVLVTAANDYGNSANEMAFALDAPYLPGTPSDPGSSSGAVFDEFEVSSASNTSVGLWTQVAVAVVFAVLSNVWLG